MERSQSDPENRPDPVERARQMADRALAGMGLPPGGWRMTRMGLHDRPDRAHAVLRLDRRGSPSLVVKAQVHPVDPAGFAIDTARNAAARAAFPKSDALGMPDLLWRDDGAMARITSFVPGEQMATAMRAADPARCLDLLAGVGRWLAALHRSDGPDVAPFYPRNAVRRWRDMAEGVRTGRAEVAARPVFLAMAADLRRRAAALASDGALQTLHALPHGDAHLGNFILTPDGATVGFDLFPRPRRPVAQDVAKALLDFTVLFHIPNEITPEDPVPPMTVAAFLAGYDLLKAGDPVLDLLLRAEVLRTLSKVPADPALRGPGKALTLARLIPVMRAMLGA